MAKFKVEFQEITKSFSLVFNDSNGFAIEFTDNKGFDVGFGEVIKLIDSSNIPHYKGDYDVTPRVDAQTLLTAQKFLDEDIKIKKIPYYEISNSSGGDTVYIAAQATLGAIVLGQTVI